MKNGGVVNLSKKKLSLEIDNIVNTGFKIDNGSDKDLLAKENLSWDDLNKLKDDLGSSVLEFVGQVNEIVNNPTIVNNLNDKKSYFEKLVMTFFEDLKAFSNKVKELRVEHENLTGPVIDLNQYNVYNRIAINYHYLYSELNTLISPTLSEILLTIADVIPKQEAQENKEKEKTDE